MKHPIVFLSIMTVASLALAVACKLFFDVFDKEQSGQLPIPEGWIISEVPKQN